MSAEAIRSKRIAKNAILLYFRMLITMVVNLYTSRIVLDVLGVEDFGIYNVVGGIVVVLSFLNNTMSTSTQRFLNYELGLKDIDGAEKVFSSSLYLHILISIVGLVLPLTVGMYFLENQMNISLERVPAARYVLVFSVLTFVFQTITVPYNSIIIAHERMSAYAYLSIIEVFAKLFVVYMLLIIKGDALIAFAMLQFIVSVLIRIAYILYSKLNFKEATFKISNIDKLRLRQMFSFSSWSILGSFGFILHTQGISIVTNIYFNSIVNAAQGIANQINSAVTSFTSSFQIALNPQIVKSYAANEIESMHELVYRGCKFSFYLIAIYTIPILIETPQILNVWLTKVPPYSVEFVRLIMLVSLVNSYSNVFSVSQGATGEIKKYQIVLTFLGLLHIPSTILCFELGYPAYYSTVVYVFLSIILQTVRLFFVSKSIKLPLVLFFKKVLLPCFGVFSLGLVLSIIIHNLLPNTINAFIFTCGLSVIIVIGVIYFIGLNSIERLFLVSLLSKALHQKNGKTNI